MDGKTDGWMDGKTDGWMDGRTDGRTERLDEWAAGRREEGKGSTGGRAGGWTVSTFYGDVRTHLKRGIKEGYGQSCTMGQNNQE